MLGRMMCAVVVGVALQVCPALGNAAGDWEVWAKGRESSTLARFARDDEGGDVLQVTDLTTGEIYSVSVRTPPEGLFLFAPEWDATRTRLLWHWMGGGQAGAGIVDVRSGESRFVSAPPPRSYGDHNACWSPSGRWVALERMQWVSLVWQAVLVPVEGGEEVVVAERACVGDRFKRVIALCWDDVRDVLYVLREQDDPSAPVELFAVTVGEARVEKKERITIPGCRPIFDNTLPACVGEGRVLLSAQGETQEAGEDGREAPPSLWLVEVGPTPQARRLHTPLRYEGYQSVASGDDGCVRLVTERREEVPDGPALYHTRFLEVELPSGEISEFLPERISRDRCPYRLGPDGRFVYWGEEGRGVMWTPVSEWKPEVVYRVPDGSEPAEWGE